MQTIDLTQSPSFIKKSIHYQQIIDNESMIDIHKRFYKPNQIIKSVQDLDWLLETIRYWMINEIPYSMIFDFLLSKKNYYCFYENHLQSEFIINIQQIIQKYFDMSIVQDFQLIMETNDKWILQNACIQGRIHLIQYFVQKNKHHFIFMSETSVYSLQDKINNVYTKYNNKNILTCDKKLDHLFLLCRFNHIHCLEYIFSVFENDILKQYYQDKPSEYVNAYQKKIEFYLQTSIFYGNLSCLQFLHKKNKSSFNYIHPVDAVRNGHLECLQYILQESKNQKQNTNLCRIACENGHLHCLQYLHKNGFPWNNMVTASAAYYNHFNCLQYAHENGCSWNYLTIQNAVKTKSFVCLQYALQNGCGVTI